MECVSSDDMLPEGICVLKPVDLFTRRRKPVLPTPTKPPLLNPNREQLLGSRADPA